MLYLLILCLSVLHSMQLFFNDPNSYKSYGFWCKTSKSGPVRNERFWYSDGNEIHHSDKNSSFLHYIKVYAWEQTRSFLKKRYEQRHRGIKYSSRSYSSFPVLDIRGDSPLRNAFTVTDRPAIWQLHSIAWGKSMSWKFICVVNVLTVRQSPSILSSHGMFVRGVGNSCSLGWTFRRDWQKLTELIHRSY